MTSRVDEPLFHVTTRAAWAAAVAAGAYEAPSFSAVGFIHLSLERQIPGVLARFFRGSEDLVLLRIDPSRLAGEVRFEAADGDSFPHLYAPLEIAAVVDVRAIEAPDDLG